MENNIIDVLRLGKWYGIYFNNKTVILSIVCAICLVMGIYIIKGLDKRKGLKTIGQNIIYLFMTIILGMILQFSGVNLSFTINYMPIFIFSLAIIITVFSYGIEIFSYKFSRQERLAKATGTLRTIIFLEVLLLTVMNRLDVTEVITVLISVSFLAILDIYIIDSIRQMNSNLVKRESDETICDKPIDKEEDLFFRRKVQLNNFKQILREISDEPFAVMVKGTWGSGKTSFINAFCKTMDRAEFVWVEAGFNSQAREMLNDIAEQINKIFKTNGIVSGGNRYISSYFGKAADMIEGAGYGFIAKILHDSFEEKRMRYSESKESLNNKLKEFYKITQKRVFIVVDNLDRLTPNERERVFEVIRESVSLKNCVTIFLVDYKAFKTDHLNDEFLEKYVNYYVALTPMTYDELIAECCDEIFPDKFWTDKSKVLKDKRPELERHIVNGPFEIVEKLEKDLEINEKALDEKDLAENLVSMYRQSKEVLTETIVRLQDRMQNPRRLIRFLKDIENMISIVDTNWFLKEGYEKNEYSSYDWLRDIFEISFLKCYLSEEYDTLLSAGNLWSYKKLNKQGPIFSVLTDLSVAVDTKKEELLQLLIYRVYALDLRSDRSRHQELLDEIKENHLSESRLMEYINEGLGLSYDTEYFKIVLAYIKNNKFDSKTIKINSVYKLMEILFVDPIIRKPMFKEIFIMLRQLVDEMNQNRELSESNNRIIRQHISHLEMHAVSGIYSDFSYVLKILFQGDDSVFPDSCDNLDSLYTCIIKIIKENSIEEIDISDQKIMLIKQFIEYVKKKLMDDEYAIMREAVYEVLDNVECGLDMLQCWDIRIITILNENIYIDYKGGRIVGKCWESMDTWRYSIQKLYDLLDEDVKESCINGVIRNFMMETERRVISNDSVFKGKEMEVYEQLKKLYSEVNKKIPHAEENWGLPWRWSTIRMYIIKAYAENNS